MHLFNFMSTSIDYCVSDNSDENSMVPMKSSTRESSTVKAETERCKSRGIWSLAETATCASRNVSTTTVKSSYFQFRTGASLIPYPPSAHFHLSLYRKSV